VALPTDSRYPRHPARRVTLRFHALDKVHHHSLLAELWQHARREPLAGATVIKAHEGFGKSGQVRHTGVASDDVPVSVVIIDSPDHIDGFLHRVAGLLDDVLVTLDDVDIVEF
jgi:uncharacterized protein